MTTNSIGGYELSETELRELYTPLVDEAKAAFDIDFSYAAEICTRARAIEERKVKRLQSS